VRDERDLLEGDRACRVNANECCSGHRVILPDFCTRKLSAYICDRSEWRNCQTQREVVTYYMPVIKIVNIYEKILQ
jgi:hypothetical protein